MIRPLPTRPDLAQLKHQAREVLRAHRGGDPDVCVLLRRLGRFSGKSPREILAAELKLADVQHAMAYDHGFACWAGLKRHVESRAGELVPSLTRGDGKAWIEGIAKIAWGFGRDCTFVGALEGALRATPRPYGYAELMGFSGLAFRVRWSPIHCPSCAVGELPEEYEAICRCTGWRLPTQTQWDSRRRDTQAIGDRIRRSIDAGRPVVGYGDSLDMALIQGYDNGGRTLLTNDYYHGEMPFRLPLEEVGPLQTYIEDGNEPLHAVQQLVVSLRRALHNWRRRRGDGGIPGRDYLYGPAAYDAWLADIDRIDELDQQTLAKLHPLRPWVALQLADARRAGRDFLRDRLELAGAETARPLERAADLAAQTARVLYRALEDQELFSPARQVTAPEDWCAERGSREREVIRTVRGLDERMMGAIAESLESLGDGP